MLENTQMNDYNTMCMSFKNMCVSYKIVSDSDPENTFTVLKEDQMEKKVMDIADRRISELTRGEEVFRKIVELRISLTCQRCQI